MSNTYVDYIDFDNNSMCPIKRVGCMNCNTTIGIRDTKKSTGLTYFKYYSNTKKYKVNISDKTYAELPICEDCSKLDLDLKKMEKTLHAGWLNEETWKYVTSSNPVHKKLKKERFGLEPSDPLPLSYFKKLFKNKKILSKGA